MKIWTYPNAIVRRFGICLEKKMIKHISFIILLLSSGLTLNSAIAQSRVRDADQAIQIAGIVNAEIQKRIQMDSNVSVSYSFKADNATNVPYASAKYGRRTYQGEVSISVPLVLLFYYFSDISSADLQSQGQFYNCTVDYIGYVKRANKKILEDHLQGIKGAAISAPEEYARRGGPCRGLLDFLPLREQFRDSRDQQVANAVALVILHEIGHIYHRHTIASEGDVGGSFEAAMRHYCMSRSQEEEADLFSFKKAYEYGWGASAYNTPLWSALNATYILPLDLANHSTHPLPSKRSALAAQEILRLSEKDQKPLPLELKRLIEQLVDTNKRLEDELEGMWRSTRLPIGC